MGGTVFQPSHHTAPVNSWPMVNVTSGDGGPTYQVNLARLLLQLLATQQPAVMTGEGGGSAQQQTHPT